MLERFEAQNFRCLKGVLAPLAPLNVLIGPNDSGKSAFLTAVSYLADQSTEASANDFWRCDFPRSEIQLRGFLGGNRISTRSFQQPGGGNWQGLEFVQQDLQPIQKYQLPSEGVAIECEGYSEPAKLDLGTTGGNLAALLDYYSREDRQRFQNVVEVLRGFVPGLDDLIVAAPTASRRRLDFKIERGLRVPAGSVSVGVRLLLFFISLAYHPKPPKLILVEEPETGVHPRRLKDVVTLLREITRGEHGGYAAQVILTTHSPFLLDHIDLGSDRVLVFQRNEDGSRSVEPADSERLKLFLDEFMLGEVWFNQGEEGMVARK